MDLATPADRIIAALDMPWNRDAVGHFVDQMLPLGIRRFKVGLRQIHDVGTRELLVRVKGWGGLPFLDAKLCDTPDTMRDAADAIAAQDPWMFNLHASCGIRSMRAAVKAKRDTLVFAVSVLTSLTPEEAELIFGTSCRAKVLQFARDAVLAGVDGMICSPLELPLFEEHEGLGDLLLATAGIRPAWAAAGQQKRFTTPAQAIRGGADFVIIGGPLANPPREVFLTPADAAKAIIDEISGALSQMTI